MENPRMLSVTLTNADTNYSLRDLLIAAEPEFGTLGVTSVQALAIQMDIDEGAARLYVGNSDVSATNYGRAIVATQAAGYNSWTGYNISLSSIYVRANTATTLIHVEILQ